MARTPRSVIGRSTLDLRSQCLDVLACSCRYRAPPLTLLLAVQSSSLDKNVTFPTAPSPEGGGSEAEKPMYDDGMLSPVSAPDGVPVHSYHASSSPARRAHRMLMPPFHPCFLWRIVCV